MIAHFRGVHLSVGGALSYCRGNVIGIAVPYHRNSIKYVNSIDTAIVIYAIIAVNGINTNDYVINTITPIHATML